ncbi:hypothetical protein GCM10025771_18020 [Niveibacterium umoris]|uniref:ABC-type amino acid transport substrate-binding protein n=1 Tax=Niveibacterium umoris TaxID=1193620 RepID=A0A840BND1_9RHOO|nr:transporter substrate-binding domain-containing protein [Niveibacterium umoris]MBB4013009.1 ABC-type amino acid transport substrate-binding protein [Niveibacterium umoris]
MGLTPSLVAAACGQTYPIGIAALGYVAFLNERGEPAGYAVDQIRELERRTGCTFEVEILPGERLRRLGQLHQLAATPFTGKPPNDDAGRTWIGLSTNSMDLVVRADLAPSEADLQKILNDPGLVVGTVRGLNYGPAVQAMLDQLPASRRDVSDDESALARKFVAGRINATPGFALVYRRWLDREGLADATVAVPIASAGRIPGGWTLWRPPLTDADQQRITSALRAMRDDGTEERLLARYIGRTQATLARFRD